ncbi:hypothetical protein ACLB2K_038249 [Fragaria x ananassa]
MYFYVKPSRLAFMYLYAKSISHVNACNYPCNYQCNYSKPSRLAFMYFYVKPSRLAFMYFYAKSILHANECNYNMIITCHLASPSCTCTRSPSRFAFIYFYAKPSRLPFMYFYAKPSRLALMYLYAKSISHANACNYPCNYPKPSRLDFMYLYVKSISPRLHVLLREAISPHLHSEVERGFRWHSTREAATAARVTSFGGDVPCLAAKVLELATSAVRLCSRGFVKEVFYDCRGFDDSRFVRSFGFSDRRVEVSLSCGSKSLSCSSARAHGGVVEPRPIAGISSGS